MNVQSQCWQNLPPPPASNLNTIERLRNNPLPGFGITAPVTKMLLFAIKFPYLKNNLLYLQGKSSEGNNAKLLWKAVLS